MVKSAEDIIRQGVAAGSTLSQIQEKLSAEGQTMTYMELRFALDDLGLTVQEKPQPKAPELAAAPTPAADGYDDASSIADAMPTDGGVRVEADRVMRPGALISGSVTFSDGVATQWSLDQMGRLGLIGAPAGYQPAQTDLVEFQSQLRAIVEKRGL